MTTRTQRPDFDAIKAQADLVKVVESYGVTLKKAGADFVGLCPFHDDTKPSLHVTPSKQLWNCPACGAGGNVLQFVAKREGCTEKEAALKLLAQLPGVMRGSDVEPSKVLCDPLKHSELFAAIIAHYHECLLGRGKRGLDYLKKRGLGNVEMIQHFKLGYVDGSLKKKLSAAQLKAARECGLINDKGNEKFYQRVVVPIYNEHGKPCGLYGRDVTGESSVAHLYLAGPHRAVWNAEAAKVYPDGLIITEAIFDALALWCAGQHNVIACYGAGGWTPHHEALIGSAGVRRVTFAFDADKKGEERAKAHAQALDAKGVACHLIEWPQGVHDANDYFIYEKQTGFRGTAESFAALLAKAPRFGFKREASPTPEASSSSCQPAELNGSRLSLVERTDEASVFQNGVLRYRVKGLGNSGSLRVVLTAMNADTKHVDQLDLYGARARRGFAATCAERFTLEAEKIEGDLLALVEALERLQQEAKASPSPSAIASPMSEAERGAALAWLKRDNLLEAIAHDLEITGYVGEPRNKKLAYLIATSRLLPKPLSGIFRAQSGCGKSYLMECVAELMPPEEVHYFSRLTPQALYYLETDALKHKLLIVDERDGSEEAEYPIRTLQTRRVLKLAVPVKDPNSGKIKTTVLEIHGPIAYMESTTDAHINPENANRCFELYLDESESQTKAIFAAQRKARTLDGWRSERHKAEVLRLHHNAQRLLRPLKVIIPFVDQIEFPAAWLRGRRDNDRFLSLIEGIAFLHQHQRTIGNESEPDGQRAEYIEASVEDYRIAYDLAHQVFAQAGSDIRKPVADFLSKMESAMKQAAATAKQDAAHFFFSRREVREAVQMPDYLVKLYMRQIEELELVEVQRATRGSSFRYRLVQRPEARATLQGLTPPDELAAKWKSGTKVEVSPKQAESVVPQGFAQSGRSGTGKLADKKVSRAKP
jgi:DNA primase catalytic core